MESNYSITKSLQLINEIGNKLIDNFQLLEYDLKVYKALIMYFHADPDFEKLKSKYKLKKGIYLHGNIGTGKSRTIEVFKTYSERYIPYNSYNILKANEVIDDYHKNGLSTIQKHGILSYHKDEGKGTISKNPKTKCFDDLGLENKKVNTYGNERNVMADILLKRYDLYIKDGMRTIITTNYNGNTIENFYGDRLRSRFKEMLNDIVYEGDDRRR
jgi:hypothetical protein